MPTKLKNLTITKVALVDEGSCSDAHIRFYKRKEGGNSGMTFEEFLKTLSEDQQALVTDAVNKAKEELPEGTPTPEQLQEKEQAVADLTKAKEDLEAKVAELEKKEETEEEEDVMKNLDPKVKALIEKAKNQATAAEAAVKKMREDQDAVEALAKAKELPNIGAPEEDLAKNLQKLKSLDEEVFNTMFGVLKAANEMIAAKESLDELGTSKDNDEAISKAADEAWTKIEKHADELMKSKEMTKEAAIAETIRTHRDLYKQYLDAAK